MIQPKFFKDKNKIQWTSSTKNYKGIKTEIEKKNKEMLGYIGTGSCKEVELIEI